MISAQIAKVFNDVWSNKTRTLLIVLSILAGLTAVGTILNARKLVAESVNRSYRVINYAQGSVTTDQAFNQDFILSLEGAGIGVKAADARSSLSTQAINAAGKRSSISVFNVPDYEDIRVNKIEPVSGKWPPENKEILIETAGLDILGAQVGDTIQVETSDGTRRALKITGTVQDLAQPPAGMMGGAYGYVNADTMEWLGGQSDYNQLKFTLQNADASPVEIETVLDKVVDRFERAGYTVDSSEVVMEIPINSSIQTILMVLGAIGGLALGLSVFLIINTISAMIAQQTRLIGVMKAVGGSRRQILAMYLAVVIFYGLLALLISIPLSVKLATTLSTFLGSSFGLEIDSAGLQLSTALVQAAIALLVPLMASLFPLVNGLKISVTQALSSGGTNPAASRADLIAKALSGPNLWAARSWLMRPILLAIRNMFRQKVRLVLTLVTLVVAGAVFMTIFNLRSTIFSSLDQLNTLQNYDMSVNFSQEYRIDEINRVMSKIPAVEATETTISGQAKRVRPDGSESDVISVIGLKSSSALYSAPQMIEGRWLADGDQSAVVITSPLLEDEPDLQVGQQLTLTINGIHRPFTIVGGTLGMMNNQVYIPYDYAAAILHNNTKTSSMMINMDHTSGLTSEAFKANLETGLKAAGFEIDTVLSMGEMKAKMQSSFNSILALLIIMALLLAVVGGLGLMGTMSINVIERTREIGILRAIGASNGGVNGVFMIESLCIGLFSCMISIPASFPITSLLARLMGSLMTGSAWTASLNPTGMVLWIIVVILLSLVANYFPARSAARLTVREVLAYE